MLNPEELQGGHAKVTGHVFLDTNGSADRDPGEKPLAGIYVSDGDRIVRTATDGSFHFSIDLDCPTRVFVIQPTGYRVLGPFSMPVTRGSHTFSFALIKDPESRETRFTFVDGGDIQFHLTANRDQLLYDMQQLQDLMATYDARFSLWPGDLTPHGTLENLQFLKECTRKQSRPFFPVFGGHDGLKSDPPKSSTHYVAVIGPLAYSWNYGGVHFLAMVSELAFLSAREQEKQARWLEQDLSLLPAGTPVILVTHIPNLIEGMVNAGIEKHNLRLIAILRAHAHIHNLTVADGVPILCSAPWRSVDWGAFTKKCRLMRVDHDTLSSFNRVLGQDKRLVVLSPHKETMPGTADIVVNAYDTALPVESVSFDVLAGTDVMAEGTLAPQGNWTWSGTTQRKLAPGDYLLKVRASSGNEQWTTQAAFSVKASSTAPLRLAWIHSTGNEIFHFGSPIIHDKAVYVGLHDGQIGFKRAGVVCLDLATGKERWRTPTDDDINSTVCASGNRIFALSNMGTLFALDKDKGKVLWKKDIHEETRGLRGMRWNMTLAPLRADARSVYAAGLHPKLLLFAFCADVATGEKRWSRCAGPPRGRGYQTAALALAGPRLCYETHTGCGALDAETGEDLWMEEVQRTRGEASPTVCGDFAYFHRPGVLRKRKVEDGSLVWEHTSPGAMNYVGQPAVADGRVLFASADSVYALDDTTGKEVWRFKTPSPGGLEGARHQLHRNVATPLIHGPHVYFGSDNGIFYVLDVDTGKPVWQYSTGVPIKASAAVSGDRVVVSAFDGNVYAFVKPVPR